ATGDTGGRDRDGAQAGTDRLPGVNARADVRASESGGVRGPDEGEADQGVAAEGTSVGAGDHREDVGQRCNGRGSLGAGIKERKRVSAVLGWRAEGTGEKAGEQPVRQGNGSGRSECALRRTREKDHLGALGKLSGEVPCNRSVQCSWCLERFCELPQYVP